MKFLNILAVCTTLLTLPKQSWANNNLGAGGAGHGSNSLIKKGGQR